MQCSIYKTLNECYHAAELLVDFLAQKIFSILMNHWKCEESFRVYADNNK